MASSLKARDHIGAPVFNLPRSPAVPSAPDELANLPGHLIRRAHQHAVGAFADALAAAPQVDLTPVQFAILQALDTSGEMTLTRLVEAIALDAATCGSTLDRLEAKALVRRSASHTDRRRKTLMLTDAGRATLQRAWPLVHAAQRAIVQRLDEGEGRQLVALLRKMIGLG
jgi:DNA-binding MarR family transcriptional regulator